MTTAHVEILVEEPSMEVFLGGLVPRFFPSLSFRIHTHSGKPAMLSRLRARLRGYAKWKGADGRIVVMVDRDGEDCTALKSRLEADATAAGLLTRTAARDDQWLAVNRIVVEELEAWYFGDWKAVRAAYPRVPSTIPSRKRFRDPDAILGGTWEAFEQVLRNAGYFEGGLRKIDAARAIAPHYTPGRSTSRSFQVFYSAMDEISTSATGAR